MIKKRLLFTISLLSLTSISFSQLVYSDGGHIKVNEGATVFSNGGIELTNGSVLTNNGAIVTTNNSSLPAAGNFEIRTSSQVDGNGVYTIQQDWINNADFTAGSSEVILYGDLEQMILTENGTETVFHKLTLTGVGNDTDRRKTVQGADIWIVNSGTLQLNDRELSTNEYRVTVENPSLDAVLNSQNINEEGFVSSTQAGALVREMNQEGVYLFPVGSSEETVRYRPVEINSNSEDYSAYAVRMNNYSADFDAYHLSEKDAKISEINTTFYHSIERLVGDENPTLTVYFVPSMDKDWESTGAWNNFDSEWKNMLTTNKAEGGHFSAITKAHWEGMDNYEAYVLVNLDYSIDIPEAFSPNGDDLNDFLEIAGLDLYPNSEIWIYNRWGTEVYHSDNYLNDWDGLSQSMFNVGGDELPEGTYYYILKLGGADGQPGAGDVHKGFVYLKR